jgi:hypothetical protein
MTPEINKRFKNLITGASPWLPLKDIPSSNTQKYHSLSEDGTSGVYIVALRSDIDLIEESNFICNKIGYIGKSVDIVSRTYSIRASVNGKTTYHNCGAYIKRKLDTIPFEEYVVKYLYCPEDKVAELESLYQSLMKDALGYTFVWREASAGKDGRLERFNDELEKLTDEEKLQVYETLYFQLKDILLRRYHDNLESIRDV